MLEDLVINFSQQSRTADIQQIIQNKLMNFDLPIHLREAAIKIALVQNREKPFLTQPMIYTFFGDHGIAESGLCKRSSMPRIDTVRYYLSGSSALNIFSRQNRIELRLVDSGLTFDVNDPKLIQRKIGKGTRNFSQDQAMSQLQLERCMKSGRDLIRTRRNQASNTVGIGIQSVGAEFACMMLLCRLGGLAPETCLQDHPAFNSSDFPWILKKFRSVLNSSGPVQDPLIELQNFGGFEMATGRDPSGLSSALHCSRRWLCRQLSRVACDPTFSRLRLAHHHRPEYAPFRGYLSCPGSEAGASDPIQ
jgi:nicotinate-nucleotide--dimethylbenzimidazole phosphoribosyltransferase